MGITDYAQKQLGDIVFLELPEVGKSVKKGEQVGSVESVKAVSEIFAPVSGTIIDVNGASPRSPRPSTMTRTGAGCSPSSRPTRPRRRGCWTQRRTQS